MTIAKNLLTKPLCPCPFEHKDAEFLITLSDYYWEIIQNKVKGSERYAFTQSELCSKLNQLLDAAKVMGITFLKLYYIGGIKYEDVSFYLKELNEDQTTHHKLMSKRKAARVFIDMLQKEEWSIQDPELPHALSSTREFRIIRFKYENLSSIRLCLSKLDHDSHSILLSKDYHPLP